MSEVIQVEKLTKIYPADKGRQALCAVDGIDFSIGKGEVFGFHFKNVVT